MTTEDHEDTTEAPHDLIVALSAYGDVDTDAVAVTVDDDPRAIGQVIDRAHRHGYVVDGTRDATDDARPVKRRLRFVRAAESEFKPEAPKARCDGGIIVAGDEGVVLEDDDGDDPVDPDDEGVEVLTDGGDDVECERCGDTGEVVKMVDGRSGMVPCPDCNQSPHECEACGKDLDRDEVVAVGPSTPAARHLGVDDVFGDFIPVCDPCFEEASEEISRGESDAVPDGGTIVDKPDQSDELIASGITAARTGHTIDVWADIDGERTVVSGVVASHGEHDGTHVVAFDTFGSTPRRVAVRFTRVINPGGYNRVKDAVLFDPSRADTFTVRRVERR